MAVFIWQLLDRRPQVRPQYVMFFKVIGLTLFLMLVIYASIWVAFYAVPILVYVGRAIVNFFLDFFDSIKGLWTGIKGLFL
jgi:hypothetical protein